MEVLQPVLKFNRLREIYFSHKRNFASQTLARTRKKAALKCNKKNIKTSNL